jgi:RNA-splicing ligase RtcB
VVPAGFDVHDKVWKPKKEEDVFVMDDIIATAVLTGQDVPRVRRSLGTLGGGNHFIELGKSPECEDDFYFLTIHSGSRNFGLKIANFYQARAKAKVGDLKGLEWLEGDDLEDYLSDMRTAQEYAHLNRRMMANAILKFFGFAQDDPDEAFEAEGMKIESVHNYIDVAGDGIIRKGAIAANKGQRVVIPWNMQAGLIVGEGKGNRDWNFSAPHGAGRVMGRGAAQKLLSVDAFKATMNEAGVWSSCVGQDTLDESPMAYKDPKVICAALADTVDVLYTVKPVYNFKAAEKRRKPFRPDLIKIRSTPENSFIGPGTPNEPLTVSLTKERL